VSPVSRDLRSTDCRLSKTCSVLFNIRMGDNNALLSLEKWTLETCRSALDGSDDNVVYMILKYMNVDNAIWSGRDVRVGWPSSHDRGGSPKGHETAVLR